MQTLCRTARQRRRNGAMFATFITKAEIAILDRVNFVDGDSDLAAHHPLLLKVARRGVRKPRTKLFTANYDLCFEYAAQRRRFVVVDGFSHASPQIYDCSHFFSRTLSAVRAPKKRLII